MPLLNLKTDLKSLKYGQDRPGGGDSGQPYIVNDINDPTNILGFDDGLVRGGAVGAVKSGITDTIRIGKFITNNPLFLVKQVGLQLSNPRLEIPKDVNNILQGSPDNLLTVGTNGLLQPTRIYNLGINTLAQIPVNAFGGHFNRHGLLPVQNEASKYEAIATANNENNNRLVKLTDKFKLGVNQSNNLPRFNALSGILGIINSITGLNIPNVLQNKELIIDQYLGGPGSTYGIGGTIINRTTFTGIYSDYSGSLGYSKSYAGRSRINGDFIKPSANLNFGDINFNNYVSARTTSKYANPNHNWDGISLEVEDNLRATLDDYTPDDYFKKDFRYGIAPNSQGSGVYNTNDIDLLYGPSSYPSLLNSSIGVNSLSIPNTVYVDVNNSVNPYVDVENKISSSLSLNPLFNVYKTARDGNNVVINYSSSYSSKNIGKITYTNSYGESKSMIGFTNWANISRENRIGSGRRDEINLTPMFDAGSYFGDDRVPNITGSNNIRDLVKFRIQAVDTDNPSTGTWMVFRAYLTDLSDDTSPDWTDVKYAGRGERFYVYNGFTRKINISFKVAALSEKEMKFIYQKLNFLMSNAMPDYNNNLMRGPLVRMTVGNWLDGQLGKLDSISFKVPQDSPWEIALDEPDGGTKLLILPHIVEVSLTFTPIGSDTSANNLISKKSTNTSHIAQNNTGDTQFQYIK